MVRALSMLDFTSLRHFLALVEAGSFSKAAHRLFVTQPAVSHQIRGLERQLGLRLITRARSGVELTDPGKLVYEMCQDLFGRLEEAEARVQDLEQAVRGAIRLGTPMGILDGWLLPQLVGFRNAHPEVEYQIVVGSDETLRDLLVERRIDVALLLEGASRHLAQLDHAPIFQEEYMLLASGREGPPAPAAKAPAGPSAGGGGPRLAGLPFIVYQEHDFMLNQWLAANMPRARHPITIRHIINHVPGMIEFVKAGLGVAVLPRHAVVSELAAGDLVEIRPPVRRVMNRFHLAYRKQRFLPLKIRSLAEWLAKASNLKGAGA
jgi:DNA-binding transcriptional LysR family regulator